MHMILGPTLFDFSVEQNVFLKFQTHPYIYLNNKITLKLIHCEPNFKNKVFSYTPSKLIDVYIY